MEGISKCLGEPGLRKPIKFPANECKVADLIQSMLLDQVQAPQMPHTFGTYSRMYGAILLDSKD
jgi:hypothetical protein